MRVLVSGADGFVGRHLCRRLSDAGDEVVAVGWRGDGRPSGPSMELTQLDSVRQALDAAGHLDAVAHLAGFSSVARSHAEPGAAFQVNVLGTVNLLTALRDRKRPVRVLLVASGEVYGAVPPGSRASEEFPLAPRSPYASSKAAAEVAGFQFARATPLEVVSARAFTHVGPGQSPGFVVPSFAAQIAAIRAGRAAPMLRVGDLSPVRDVSHVGDVVEAYRLLLAEGRSGEAYNVCSGEGRSVRSLLDELLELAGLTGRVEVEVDPARLRPAEIPSLVGNPAKIEALGWRRTRTVRQALAEVLAEA